MDTECQPEPVPFVSIEQEGRNAITMQVKVSHDLGDRTLVVVILLACIIGVCGVVIGQHNARDDMLGQYMRDNAAKLQINTNHTMEVEKQIGILQAKEKSNAPNR